VVANLLGQIQSNQNIMLYTNAELTAKSGHIGDFTATIRLNGEENVSLNVGAIITTTGFTPYEPHQGEYGWGAPGVVTLLEFRQMLEAGGDELTYNGKQVRDVAFIYCVGSRQTKSETYPEPNTHCSRFCCMATAFSGSLLHEYEERSGQSINQYHLYRDVRTYGHLETVYSNARTDGGLFLRWDPKEPPQVEQSDGRLAVKVKDTLFDGDEELEIGVDLVVLATGMTPRENDALNEVLKVPKSKDGFYNEIHIKLRPVETAIDGVCIAGTAQGPKNLSESVASSLAAVARTGAILKKGYLNLEPLVAKIDTDKCVWCDECLKACPYGAIEKVQLGDKEVAMVLESSCKGEGACVPVCAEDAIDIEGFREDQILAMIDASLKESTEA
jgi:heterodisulfide reductase subunit A